MADETPFSHLMDHIISFYCEINDLIFNKPDPFVAKGAVTKALCDMIAKTIFVLEDALVAPWMDFLIDKQKLMLSSPEMYVEYVIKICLMEEQLATDTYEKFINVCGLVTVIGFFIYQITKKNFYKLSTRICTVLFENILIDYFRKRSDWKRLEKYIRKYIQVYDELVVVKNLGDLNKVPKKLINKMANLALRRRTKVSTGLEVLRITDYSGIGPLTYQVISTIGASLMTELSSSSLEEELSSPRDKFLEPLSEFVAPEKQSLDELPSPSDKFSKPLSEFVTEEQLLEEELPSPRDKFSKPLSEFVAEEEQLLLELSSPRDKFLEPLTEFFAAEEKIHEAEKISKSSNNNEGSGVNKQDDYSKIQLSNTNMFSKFSSAPESSISKKEADSAAKYLLSVVEHVEHNIEHLISIFNLL
ncbi:hypothetical protein TNIN_488761 [Trichonephila inaurata madagascariensis]|uniref:Uncharacterized protein n=1 Tax=Trichonephila inaurata madagascariensis TaxID=2747483 RepID=A0A8X6WZK6_9ARAC|nr:hypothetical protein TNIN_488761 [Trichonephila inaurata madagascariensis]